MRLLLRVVQSDVVSHLQRSGSLCRQRGDGQQHLPSRLHDALRSHADRSPEAAGVLVVARVPVVHHRDHVQQLQQQAEVRRRRQRHEDLGCRTGQEHVVHVAHHVHHRLGARRRQRVEVTGRVVGHHAGAQPLAALHRLQAVTDGVDGRRGQPAHDGRVGHVDAEQVARLLHRPSEEVLAHHVLHAAPTQLSPLLPVSPQPVRVEVAAVVSRHVSLHLTDAADKASAAVRELEERVHIGHAATAAHRASGVVDDRHGLLSLSQRSQRLNDGTNAEPGCLNQFRLVRDVVSR